jgi:hypothetical protein
MVFAFAAPPAGAAEGTTQAPTPTSDTASADQPTLLAMADAKVQDANPAEAMARAQDNQMTADKPFLKSGKGLAAVALLVAGTILVAYSRSNDRITSPVRE